MDPRRAETVTCARPDFLSPLNILPRYSTLNDSISIIMTTTRPVIRTALLRASSKTSSIQQMRLFNPTGKEEVHYRTDRRISGECEHYQALPFRETGSVKGNFQGALSTRDDIREGLCLKVGTLGVNLIDLERGFTLVRNGKGPVDLASGLYLAEGKGTF